MTDMTRDEIKEIIREVLEEHHEFFGLPIDTTESREQLRADAAFVRRMRHGIDGVASKVGYAVIMAIVAAIGGLIVAGMHASGIKV